MKINLFYDTAEGITKFTTLESEYILFSGKLVIATIPNEIEVS